MNLSRRLSAALLALAIAAGSPAICAGWLPTPEARIECCAGPCPMHESDADHHGTPRSIGQAEADACCAASESDDPAQTPLPAVTVVSAPLNSPVVPFVLPDPAHGFAPSSTPAPPSSSAVPIHLRLSVFRV